MRTTLRIENNLLQELKDLAHSENIPLTRLVNQVLRRGLHAENQRPKTDYHETICDLGKPYFKLDKALAISAQLEDEEVLRKIEMRK